MAALSHAVMLKPIFRRIIPRDPTSIGADPNPAESIFQHVVNVVASQLRRVGRMDSFCPPFSRMVAIDSLTPGADPQFAIRAFRDRNDIASGFRQLERNVPSVGKRILRLFVSVKSATIRADPN